MRSICTALVLLLAYFIFVFVAFRVLDIVIWLQQSVSSTEIVDPLFLSVRQLKQLLEIRGVSFTGYVEKQELAKLVEASGDVVQGDVDELHEIGDKGEKEKLSTTPGPSYFLGAGHFYEEVEDTKDSVWLVQVVPVQKSEPLLDDYNWRVVRSQVAPFAIRTGIFDCKLDRRLCSSKGWNEPLLLLALPRGTKPKDKVIMRNCKLTKPQAIIGWLRKELSIRVKKIASYEDLEKNWLGSSNNTSSNESSKGVKVLLLTHLLHPPLFLAALSIKFTGRISFGIFSVKKEETQKVPQKVPTYMIITPEKNVIYGRRRMEHFNLKSMNAFLRTVQPEMNDIFLCSLALVNIIAVFQAIQIPATSWWRILVTTLWIVVISNLSLFALWLVFLGTIRSQFTALIGDWCLSILRVVVLSDIGVLIRSDWMRLLKTPWIFFSSVALFSALSRKRVRGENERREEEMIEPLEGEEDERREEGERGLDERERRDSRRDLRREGSRNFTLSPHLSRLSPPTPPSMFEFEEELENLIERLAVPNLWLTPGFSSTPPPTDYVKDLFVWKYRSKRRVTAKKDSPDALQRLMDAEDDSVLLSRLSRSSEDSESRHSACDEERETHRIPEGVIETSDCAVCLEKYKSGVKLCALPCGHNYHQKCIIVWLERDNPPRCPLCRFPASTRIKRRHSEDEEST